MKTSNTFAACVVLLTSSILSTPAMADKATLMRATGKVPDHVTCPSNTDASFSGGVLKCSVTLVYTRGSICPPINYPNYTNVVDTGADKCLPVGKTINGRNDVPSAMDPLPGPPRVKGQAGGLSGDLLTAANTVGQAALLPADSAYTRVVNPGRMDTFVAEKLVYLWPLNLPPLYTVGHDASKGVTCPAGFADVQGRNTSGLGCEQLVKKTPMCQNIGGLGWTIKVKAGRDECRGTLGDVGPTKPDGTIGETGPEWTLVEDGGEGKTDSWQRYNYKPPVTR